MTEDKDNLTLIPTQPDKFRGMVEQMKRDFEAIVEFRRLQAKAARSQYEALVDAGFTPQEALTLVAPMIK